MTLPGRLSVVWLVGRFRHNLLKGQEVTLSCNIQILSNLSILQY